MRKCVIATLLLGLTLGQASLGNNAEQPSQLSKIKQQISQVTSTLNGAQKKRQNYLAQLERSEVRAGQLSLSIKKNQQNTKTHQQQISQLKQQAGQLQGQLTQQRELLKKQLRHTYMTGREPYLKLMLNQKSPADTNRLLVYYNYINKDRKRAIASLNQTLTKISNNQNNQKQQQALLKTAYQNLVKEKQQATGLNKQRQTIISKLNQQISNNQARLTQLQSNKKQLEQALSDLAKRSQGASTLFGRSQGKLPWPLSGKILQAFGRKIDKSELHYTGVVLSASQGQDVRAIAGGKLVFAKWMPGYGLLAIVDHGGGYMSLYGRLNDIAELTGTVIKKNSVIGSAGKSGGYASPSLYFAIRHNAKPLNPSQWCQKQT